MILLIFLIKLRKIVLGSIIIYTEMLILGCMYTKINNVKKKYSNILRNAEAYICTSKRTKDIKNKYTSMNFIVLKVKKNNIWHNINDVILTNVVIKNENLRKYTIFYGDAFIINGSPRLIGSSGNININSFYKYYTQNGIHYNHFVDLYKIKYLGSKPISQVRYIFEKINYILKTNTLKNIKNNDSKYILSNLLFGKGDDIKKELKESYIKSGIIHILAISGLHITIIFFIFIFILSYFVHNKNVSIIFSLALSWIYGCIISMPTSVLRALLMISFYKISDFFNRNSFKYSFIFNSLIISLIINQSWIYSIGFQLSYLATFGIILIQKDIYIFFKRRLYFPLERLNDSKNKSLYTMIFNSIYVPIIRYLYGSISVFIAANIFIFPVLLYNFHYINFFSICTNIIILPFMPLIIFLGVILLVFCWTTYLNLFISYILSYLISFINFIIIKLSNVELFMIHSKQLNLTYIFAYYIIIMFIIIYFKNRNTNILFSG